MFDRIAAWCVAWAVGHATVEECERLGMAEAQRIAARRAIDGLGLGEPTRVLVDGNWDFVGRGTTVRLVKGDARCLSISAASILAKVTRDRLMREESENHPGYDFDLNKGYPCPRHKLALAAYGPTAIHRRSWVFMDHLVWNGLRRVVPGGQFELPRMCVTLGSGAPKRPGSDWPRRRRRNRRCLCGPGPARHRTFSSSGGP